MAQIPNTALSWQDMADPVEMTLANGDTLDFRGEGHVLLLRNPTGAAIWPVLTGSDATFVDLPGVGRVSLSGGYAVGAIAAGATAVLPIGVHYHWLAGAVTLTNCAGLRAVSLEDARGYRPADLPFSPSHLFRRGEVGLIIDPSRLDTLFQDAAGAIPITGPGQPVGLVINTVGGSIKPAQGVSASRPTLGRHPRSGIRNLLSNSRALASGVWVGGGGLLSTANAAALGVSGQMTASLLIESTAASSSRNRVQGVNVVPGHFYTMSAIVKSVGPQVRHVHLVCELGSAFGGNPNATLNMLTGVVTQTGGVDRTAGAENLGDGWWRVWMRARCVAAGINGFRLAFSNDPASPWTSYTGDGASGVAVDGVQVETGAGMTAYQDLIRASQYDVTESGQPDVWYLDFDGIDDGLDAAFAWSSDAVTAIAAIHKRSDAVSGNVVSFGAYNAAGGWRISAPVAAGQSDFGAFSGAGSNVTISSAGDIAPTSAVVSMRAKTQAPLVQLRRNGQQVAESVAAQGSTLAYAAGAAAVLQIGRWYGADPLNGRIYGLIAINRALSDSELLQASRWLAGRIDLAA